VRRASTNTSCGLLCRVVPPVLPASRTSIALFERLLASPVCPSGVSSIVGGQECGVTLAGKTEVLKEEPVPLPLCPPLV